MTNCPSCGSQSTRCGCTDQPFTCDRHGYGSWDRDTCPSCNDELVRRQRFSVGEYVRDELAARNWSTLDAAAKKHFAAGEMFFGHRDYWDSREGDYYCRACVIREHRINLAFARTMDGMDQQ